jgi:hypothetical protein
LFTGEAHDLVIDHLVEDGQLALGAFELARVESFALLFAGLLALRLETGAEVLDADLVVLPQE